MKDLGDRMKGYERTFATRALKRTPLIIRVDGRAFHTVTKGCQKPFDPGLMSAMDKAALEVAGEMQGFKLGYVQSDEATFFLTDYDRLESSGWFDYKMQKVVSLSAALMSVAFNKRIILGRTAVFDSRAFSVPEDEVANVFLWRAKDWARNSLQMYARAFFSHKEMNGKKMKDLHDMLHSIGKNWTTDLSGREKNGCFIIKNADGRIETVHSVEPTYDSIQGLMASRGLMR